MSVIDEWMSVLDEWMSVLDEWMSVYDEWMDVLDEWMSEYVEWMPWMQWLYATIWMLSVYGECWVNVCVIDYQKYVYHVIYANYYVSRYTTFCISIFKIICQTVKL